MFYRMEEKKMRKNFWRQWLELGLEEIQEEYCDKHTLCSSCIMYENSGLCLAKHLRETYEMIKGDDNEKN